MAGKAKIDLFPTWGTEYQKYLEKIGEGAFGKVYKAQGLHDKKTYAIKQISVQDYQIQHNESNKDMKTWKDSLLQEVHFLIKLESEFVMRYYVCGFQGPNSQKYFNEPENCALSITDTCPTTDWFYIKMDFCEEDLKKWINENNLEERQPHKISIINQILNGLEYIHRQQVIHRDIKPANIMLKKIVNSENKIMMNSFQVKIGDFGLSKLVDATSDSLNSRRVGTRIYMSPEMKLGSKYGYKTDIYSAGLVLFEIINPILSRMERYNIFNEDIQKGSAVVFPTTGDSQNEINLIQNMTKFKEDERLSAWELLKIYEQESNSQLGDDERQKASCMDTPCGENIRPSSSYNNFRKRMGEEVLDSLEDLNSVNPSQSTSPSSSKWPIFFNVTNSNRNYVGRTNELFQLEQIYENQAHKIVVLSGLGGIGKSELARKFAHNLFNKEKINCIWLNGETQQNLKLSINKLAAQLKVPIANSSNSPRETNEILSDIIDLGHQNVSKSWLIILDNVESLNSDLTSLLEFLFEVPDTLAILTTRNIEIADEEMKLILLENWTNEDATAFLKKTLTFKKDDEASLIPKLCKKLENHPLAMNQAAAYIIQERSKSTKGANYGISEYLSEFKSTAEKLLGFKLSKIVHKNIKPVLITWDMTIENLKTNYEEMGIFACDLLNQIAYLDPNGIPNYILVKTSLSLTKELNLDFERLKSEQARLDTFSLPPGWPVQFIKAEDCAASGFFFLQDKDKVQCAFCRGEGRNWAEGDDPASEHRRHFPTCPFVCGLPVGNVPIGQEKEAAEIRDGEEPASVLKKIVPSPINESNVELVEKAVRLLKGYSLIKCEENVVYIHRLVQEVTRIKLKSTNDDFFTLLKMMVNLCKNYSPSIVELTHLQCVWKFASRIDSLLKFVAGNTPTLLSNGLYMFGFYSEMLKFCEKYLPRVSQVRGENDFETLKLKGCLAKAYELKGNYDQSIIIYEEVVEKLKEIKEEEEVLTQSNNLAIVLIQLNKHEKAMSILKTVLEAKTRSLGDNHPDVITIKNNIAILLDNNGASDIALEMLNDVLEWQERELGPLHNHTLSTKQSIGSILAKQNKLKESKTILEDVISCRNQLSQEDHPTTLWARQELGLTLCLLGECKEGVEMLNEVLTKQKDILGIDHPDTKRTQYILDLVNANQKPIDSPRESTLANI